MHQPFRAAHQFRGQVAADKTVEPRRFVFRQAQQREARHDGALRQFELAAEGARLARMQAQRRHRAGGLIDRSQRRERDAHRPLAPRQKPAKPLAVFVGFGEPEQFEIVLAEHDAVIGRALAEMAAPRGRREAEPDPAGAGGFEIADRDDDVIDTRQAVAHGPLSCTPTEFTEAARPRPSRRAAANGWEKIPAFGRKWDQPLGPARNFPRLPPALTTFTEQKISFSAALDAVNGGNNSIKAWKKNLAVI